MKDTQFTIQANNVVVNNYTITFINGSQQPEIPPTPSPPPKQKSIDWNVAASFIKRNWKQIVALLTFLFPALCH